MRIAYLEHRLNDVGKTFVWSEMEAVAALGHEVQPYSVRASQQHDRGRVPGEVIPPPRVLAGTSPGRLTATLLMELRRHPRRLAGGARLAARTSPDGIRGRLRACFHLSLGAELARSLREHRVDHLHNHAIASAPVALVAAHLTGMPYSLTTHGPPEYDPPAVPQFALHAKHAAFIVAISSIVRAEVCRQLPADLWRKVHVIRCGLTSTFLSRPPTTPPDTVRIACVARLDARKGQSLLLAAARELLDSGVPLQLRLVGDGPLRKHLEGTIERLGLAGSVMITGWADPQQVRSELIAARGLVLPSLAEGLPVAIMEALALGRPVIGTAVGAVGDLVKSGETGWLIAPADSDDLRGALRALLQTPIDRLAAMGWAGAQRVRERHDASREAVKLVALIYGESPR